ncbi:Rtt106-domain-containing protein [Lindgomyces ingoldianus]|uniref:Rtt106-domain-containing protein n=1 Tax=Lindgomyces ingoldianus TaxID=673940 RepID=A0ACB6QIU0_9PLEO|nr:Rtt106-domain-containing protein [Lindgomyces ingoldianus]KAF2466869.1 Rtt106-domain-containing protein [Lindgomyces ingoldianus]
MAGAHTQEIDLAFAGNHELRKRVHAAIDQNPTQITLFRDISSYMLNHTSPASAEPATKKRKLDDSNGVSDGAIGGLGRLASTDMKAWRSYPSVSFSIPQRKKLTLELVTNKAEGGIRGLSADGKVEFGIAWKDVDQVFCLPVPEKAKRQHNFVVLPIHGDGVNPVPEHLKASPPEAIVWTFEEATGKNIIEGEDPGPGPMAEAIHHCLIQAGTGKSVIFPTAEDFQSAIVQNHRKGEKAYHVKAHRGSKDGYLFLTSVGIIFGFKKPLLFFDFSSINSISYTAVLRNTFNLVITTSNPSNQEIEFAMIDQADYPGIQEYVQKHELQDASMAAARRAKKLNVNPPVEKRDGTNGESKVEDGDEETELEKAARLLQDQEDEDEDEEDYDPGSEGESEGSGEDSDDEEDGDGGEEGYEEADGEEYEEGYEEGYEEAEGGSEEMEGQQY